MRLPAPGLEECTSLLSGPSHAEDSPSSSNTQSPACAGLSEAEEDVAAPLCSYSTSNTPLFDLRIKQTYE